MRDVSLPTRFASRFRPDSAHDGRFPSLSATVAASKSALATPAIAHRGRDTTWQGFFLGLPYRELFCSDVVSILMILAIFSTPAFFSA